jgi:hypothetical protein
MAREPLPRPTQPSQGDVGAPQRMASKFIIFTDIAKINTRSARDALPENEAAWMENLQPVAANKLVAVPAPLPPLATLVGEQSMTMFAANIGNVDYIIDFTLAGAGIAVNADTGVQTKFAPDGTFTKPDMTVYASQRILIIDPQGGYSTWDGTVFISAGGLSPKITVTTGGSGYNPTSPPPITFTGGAGTGATGHAVVSGGSVVSIVLDTPGTGYFPTDAVSVTIGGPGTGAAATAKVWPRISGTTIAVFSGRVWTANGRLLSWTGTGGYDDVSSTSAGTTTISDADLSHVITGLRSLNNYLFIFGDTSVRQIGNITISPSVGITLFTPLTLASDIGTRFIKTIQSYNRLLLFANRQGVYAIFGASVEKISDDLDGIFQMTDFGQPPEAGLNDLRNTHCYLLLLRYQDPLRGPRSLLCMFQEKKWYLASQGDAIKTLCTVPLASSDQIETFASSGSDITQILQDTATPVTWTLQTALSSHGNLIQAKQALQAGVFGHSDGVVGMQMTIDTEFRSNPYPLNFGTIVTWLNNFGGHVTFVNNVNAPVYLSVGGHQFPYSYVDSYGKVQGITLTATSSNTILHVPVLEYQDADLWGQYG